jgi:hypothetical protein
MVEQKIRRIYILGDLHLGVKNASIEWSDIQSDFLVNTFIEAIDKDGFDPETDILIQVGDWHHVRESTNVRIQGASLNIAKVLCNKFKRGVHVILGNHDVYYKDQNDVHSLVGFNEIFDNFHVYESPKILNLNSHKFLMLPWIDSTDKFRETISKYKSADFVVCHADIKGAKLSKTTKLDHGVEYSELNNYKRVYSGHIHIRQDRDNVLYVGTPYQMDRGDIGNSKGFYVLEINGTEVSERFIENNSSPRFIKYNIHDLLELSLNEIKNRFNNNFIDVYIDHDFAKAFPITRFIELVKDCGHRSLEFQPYSTNTSQDSAIEVSQTYEYNIFDVLSEYLKSRELPSHKSDLIYSKFKSVYEELKNNKPYNE